MKPPGRVREGQTRDGVGKTGESRLSEHWRGRTQEASVPGVQTARRLAEGKADRQRPNLPW